jgi:hypothetical protein
MAGSISGIDWVSRMPVSGVYTAVAGDNSAGKAEINTGMANAVGCIVQVIRSGVDIATDGKFSVASGVLAVESGSNYKVTAGDVINWIVF